MSGSENERDKKERDREKGTSTEEMDREDSTERRGTEIGQGLI